MIDPTFRNINKLFVLSFKNAGDDATRNYFINYYIPLFEIKDFYALIEYMPSFDHHVKNKQEAYQKMWRNNNYKTGNLLHYLHHQKYYKLIGTGLSIQAFNYTGIH